MFGAEPVASLELLQQRLWKLASPDILHRGQCHARSMSHSGDGDDDRLDSRLDVDPDLRRIEEAPPGFPGLRLTASGPKKPDSGMQMDVGNPDGSYSFRSVETWIKVDHLANSHLADTTNYQSIVFLGQYLLFMEPTQT